MQIIRKDNNMDNQKIDGSAGDLQRLQEMHERRMILLFNIRGFVFAADVAWIVLMAPLFRVVNDYGFLEKLLIGISILFSALTLISLAFSFRKDIRQTGELFVEMYKQLRARGSLEDGISAASTRWYEELSCVAWPGCFACSIIVFFVAMLLPVAQQFVPR